MQGRNGLAQSLPKKKINPQLYPRAVTTYSGDMSGLQLTSYKDIENGSASTNDNR